MTLFIDHGGVQMRSEVFAVLIIVDGATMLAAVSVVTPMVMHLDIDSAQTTPTALRLFDLGDMEQGV